MKAIELFTQYSTGEFAVRPFFLRYESQMTQQMLQWSTHENYHVRRLSSEGSRPRLPWGVALKKFKLDPSPIFPILENLKNDESEYVRKSVANNLNDILKDNPDIVLQTCKRWQGASKNTDWIVKHGLRTLLKKGDARALDIIGVNQNLKISIANFTIDHEVKIGQDLHFSFELISRESKATEVRMEYIVEYLKANGSHSPKTFKISERQLDPKESILIERKQSFLERTTRKHYPGIHALSIVINGNQMTRKEFTVLK